MTQCFASFFVNFFSFKWSLADKFWFFSFNLICEFCTQCVVCNHRIVQKHSKTSYDSTWKSCSTFSHSHIITILIDLMIESHYLFSVNHKLTLWNDAIVRAWGVIQVRNGIFRNARAFTWRWACPYLESVDRKYFINLLKLQFVLKEIFCPLNLTLIKFYFTIRQLLQKVFVQSSQGGQFE